jgi:hypothetical protein
MGREWVESFGNRVESPKWVGSGAVHSATRTTAVDPELRGLVSQEGWRGFVGSSASSDVRSAKLDVVSRAELVNDPAPIRSADWVPRSVVRVSVPSSIGPIYADGRRRR